MIFKNKKNKNKINHKGYSLIELMVAMAILSFVVIGLVTLFTGGTRSWISGQNQLQAQREARMTMDRMVKEIREGKSVISGNDNAVTISFPNALGKENVSFALIGSSVKRNDSNILINNIPGGGLTFLYFDDAGIGVEDPTMASKLKIVLQVDVDGDMSSGGNPDIIIETEVNLRNYGLKG